jgi:hypothetical protein
MSKLQIAQDWQINFQRQLLYHWNFHHDSFDINHDAVHDYMEL